MIFKYFAICLFLALSLQVTNASGETGGIVAIAPYSELRDSGSEQESFRSAFFVEGTPDLSQFPQAKLGFLLDKAISDPYRYGSNFIQSVQLEIGPFSAQLSDGGISRMLYEDSSGIAGTRFDLGGMISPGATEQAYAGQFRLAGAVLLIYLEGVFQEDWDELPFRLEEVVASSAFIGASISVFFDGPRIDFGGSTATVRPLNPLTINAEMIYECNKIGGADVAVSGTYLMEEQDPIVSYSWQVNNSDNYHNPAPSVSLKLGKNNVSLAATSANGETFNSITEITIEDTQAPDIQLAASSIGGNLKHGKGRYSIDFNVTDTCDVNPKVTAVAGIPVSNGDTVVINPRQVRTEKSEGLPEIVITASDESGNRAIATTKVGL